MPPNCVGCTTLNQLRTVSMALRNVPSTLCGEHVGTRRRSRRRVALGEHVGLEWLRRRGTDQHLGGARRTMSTGPEAGTARGWVVAAKPGPETARV